MAILLSASQDVFVVPDYSKILDWKNISAIQKSGAGKFPECNEPAVNQQLLQQDARLYRQVGSGIYKNSDTGVFVGAYDWQGDTRDCQDCEEVSFSSQSWQIPWSISPLHCRRNPWSWYRCSLNSSIKSQSRWTILPHLIHFIVAGNGIGYFISGIIAVISVLVILVGTYMTSSGIKKILKSISLYCMSMIQLVVNTKN